MTVTYATLTARNPLIADLELTRDRQAMYAGGAAVKARARRFIHPQPNQPEAVYRARLDRFVSEDYAGRIISHFANMLCKSPPSAVATRSGRELHDHETDYYSALKENCDRAGTDIDVMFKGLFTDAATTGLGWLLVHSPQDMSGLEPPENRADWEARGLGNLWLEKLDYEAVTDFECDESGNLSLAIVHRVAKPRLSVGSNRDRVIETWEVYSAAGAATDVETFRIEYSAKDGAPKPDTVVPSIDLRPLPFGQIPLICLSFGPGLHLMATLESPQIAHTAALNAENWALGLSAYSQLLLNVADPDGFAGPKVGPGWGIVLGKDDKCSWLEPSGNAFDALNRAKVDAREAVYRLGSAMALGANSDAVSVGRSAESKAIDHEASRIALRAWADQLKEVVQRTYALIANVRGESVTWRVDGCDDFDIVAYLEALKMLRDGLDGPVHSPQARAALESRALEALLPDATLQQRDVMRRETLAAIVNEPTSAQREANELAALHGAVHGNDNADATDAALSALREEIARLSGMIAELALAVANGNDNGKTDADDSADAA